MQPPYRDTLEVVRAELAVARARRTATIETAGQLVPMLARRWARVIFGVTLILAAPAMGIAALARPAMGTLTIILSGSLALALVLRLAITRLLVQALRRRIRSLAARDPAGARPGFTEADPQSALEALRTEPCPGAAFVERVARWESVALTLPLTGLCLILPLSIHLVVWAGIEGIAHAGASAHHHGYWSEVASFDEWIRASAVLVGVAHLVLVLWVFRYVAALRRAVGTDGPSSFTPLLVAVMGAAFPGVLFIWAAGAGLLPMLIALATGIAFIPATLNRAARLFRDERAYIQVVEEALAPRGR